ncbi:MAG: glycosyltransferase family 2 protein [Abditibacteriaceae bacterium]
MISFYIITYNEATNIERCLKSTIGLVDETIIVDSGSTDATCEIARNYGAKVLLHAWEGYVAQRNFALSQCSHEWVLMLDADEELSPELRLELETLKPQLKVLLERGKVAFAMTRRVFYRGQWIMYGDWVPDYVTRLFRRDNAHYTGGLVHESVKIDGKTSRLLSPIFHYTYCDRADHLARIEKYSTLWAESQTQQGRQVSAAAPLLRGGTRFIRSAFFKRGILQGALGWDIARLAAYEVWLKYHKLYALQKKFPSSVKK